MASDAVPVSTPAGLVHGSQAPKPVAVSPVFVEPTVKGKPLQPATAANRADIQALVAQLNKYLNDSGRPAQFRVDPASRGKTIQEINPASGDVIGEYSAAEFPELARSVGVSGVLVDSHA